MDHRILSLMTAWKFTTRDVTFCFMNLESEGFMSFMISSEKKKASRKKYPSPSHQLFSLQEDWSPCATFTSRDIPRYFGQMDQNPCWFGWKFLELPRFPPNEGSLQGQNGQKKEHIFLQPPLFKCSVSTLFAMDHVGMLLHLSFFCKWSLPLRIC